MTMRRPASGLLSACSGGVNGLSLGALLPPAEASVRRRRRAALPQPGRAKSSASRGKPTRRTRIDSLPSAASTQASISKFAAFLPRPHAHRQLATALEARREQSAPTRPRSAYRHRSACEESRSSSASSARASMPIAPCPAAGRQRSVESTSVMRSAISQAVEAGFGQDDGVVIAPRNLRQPRVHVSANLEHLQIRTAKAQLRLAAQAARAHARALRQLLEANPTARHQARRAHRRACRSRQAAGRQATRWERPSCCAPPDPRGHPATRPQSP